MPDQPRTLHKSPGGRLRLGRRTAIVVVSVIASVTLTACGDNGPPKRAFDVAPYVHKGHVVNCDVFKTQADAQAVLRADALDPNALDRDGDGIACPSRPEPTDKKPVHRDFMTDKDGAPVIEPLKSPSA
ncbi:MULTISPECIES: excalibur calcium-binding domain-containing protein [unclassified Streptomyces]|uniref:excalibur calcium-binding domain-containing protein n=1 Tax=unclassified Streptomyces TaxID=2593676 RepID=UPI0033BC9350